MKTIATPRKFAVLLAALLLCSLLIGPFVHAESGSVSKARTTWLWHTALIQTDSSELLDFAKSQGVGILYLQISTKVDLASYRSFIRQATEMGIEIHALNGAPDWALETSRPKLDAFMTWIRDYQRSAAPEEKLAGIQVDIEPYLLPIWKTDYAALVNQWQNNINQLVAQASDIGLPLSAALPFWLDNYKVPDNEQTLSSWMISKFDSVTLMSYRDSAKAIYDTAKTEFAEGEGMNKKIYTGVETKPSKEGNSITFYEEGIDVLNEQLVLLEQMGGSQSSFGGIAVHDLVGWMDLAHQKLAQ
ncbi:hypothetical protein J25TS5_43000 [Paenibacillus faecis]|uniref:hypothetical protein n=1 Tax=Paenibacillus faecis TaxID=862114 RepID=UPI001B1D5804|nr:hypothetical protein [Paenibacillus faecis]GIO87368.1 hypothetical protein J25TS5_43000 [Paenibacillus faecis]